MEKGGKKGDVPHVMVSPFTVGYKVTEEEVEDMLDTENLHIFSQTVCQ